MAVHATTAEVILRVRTRIAEPTASMISDNQLGYFITECQRDLCFQLPDAALWPVIVDKSTTIVTGQEAYTFEAAGSAATRFVRELSVKYKAAYAKRLEAADVKKLAVGQVVASEAKPYYTILNDGITFELGGEATQAGAEVFIIRYVKLPADIDNGAGSVGLEFPWAFYGPIEDFVVSRAWEQREEPERATAAYQSYMQRLGAIVQHYRPGENTHLYQSSGVRS